jgi:hypothetical protein
MDDARRRGAALEAWTRSRRWGETSAGLKRARDRWKRVVFWLGFAGLVLGPIAAGDLKIVAAPAWLLRAISVASGLAVALAAYVTENVLGPSPDVAWVRARQAAEGLKSLAFAFLLDAPPFDRGDPVEVLDAELARIDGALQGAALVPAPLADEDAARGFPESPLSPAGYLDGRLREQQRWFEGKVAENRRAAGRLEQVRKGLGALAVVLGAVAALPIHVDAWIGVITAVVMALGAQLTAGRYRFLEKSYGATAARLARIATRWQLSEQGPQDARRMVADGEAALREENAGWVQAMLGEAAEGTPAAAPAPASAASAGGR